MVSYPEREKSNFEGSVKIRIIPFGTKVSLVPRDDKVMFYVAQ